MKIDLIPLKTWISDNCGLETTTKQKDEAAFLLGVGVATVYRWLKEGNRYVEDLGSDDCGGSLVVWKRERLVEA